MKNDMTLEKIVSGPRLIIGYLGITILFVGIFCLMPLVVLLFYPEESVYTIDFALPGILSIIVGFLMSRLLHGRKKRQLEHHQDAILVVLVWLTAIAICSMPFLLSSKYNVVQSLFESTSGFTTTGLSVVDVSTAPHIFLLFRSMTMFLGGVGLVLVFTSVFSDRYGFLLYNAEGHNDLLLPNLIKSSRIILSIYSFYILAGITGYVLFGMPLFDAINHSIASVSTGGFSTQTDSIGAYHNLGIEIVTIILMLLGSTNFFIHVKLLSGRLKDVFRHNEVRFLLFLSIFILPVIVLIFLHDGYGFGRALRYGAFQYVSAITTTGFQNIPTFLGMPSIFLMVMVILMLIGAGQGSTGGGIKQQRVFLIFKSIYWNIRDNLSNPRQINSRIMNKAGEPMMVSTKEQSDTITFAFLYLILFFIGTLVFVAYGYPILDSMFEFASSLGTVGLSTSITGYAAPSGVLVMSIIGMFFGRLEIYVIIYALLKGVSRRSPKGR